MAYGAGMARRQSRPLLVVYVTSSYGLAAPQAARPPRSAEALERWLLTELDEVAAPADLQVHVRTPWGRPARELSAVAAELSADALVIGAPMHFWHRLAGSVPAWLTAHASCPVIVIP
jgi:nucleotide-binding universal stress UspA family protein